jgi:hypothetical protein
VSAALDTCKQAGCVVFFCIRLMLMVLLLLLLLLLSGHQ